MMDNLAEALRAVVRGEVLDDSATLNEYSHDASLFEVRPRVVVFPEDAEDVGHLVRYVAERQVAGENFSITARSAGTDMTGGPLSESIVVSCTKHLNHIREVGEGYVVTEPGVFYRDLEKATLKRGYLLPCYPASRELCTVGGMVANNAGGEKTLLYGKTEQYVEQVKMVLRDGEEHTFRKLTLDELAAKEREQSLEGEIYRNLHHLIETHESVLAAARPKVSKHSSGISFACTRS